MAVGSYKVCSGSSLRRLVGCGGGPSLMLPRAVFQAQKLLAQRRPRRSFFEPSIRALIILCASLAVVLSSLSICDGHWLLVDDRLFGLWHFCTTSNQAELHCL